MVRDRLGDDVVEAAALARCVGSRVTVAGWIAVRRATDGLHRSWRCELDDGTALFEARLPDRLVGSPLGGPWRMSGEVRTESGRVELVVDDANPLELESVEVQPVAVLA